MMEIGTLDTATATLVVPQKPKATRGRKSKNNAALIELNIQQNAMASEYLDREVEADLARRWIEQGDETAMKRLVTSHMRLAAKEVRRISRKNTSAYNDLMQEASLGLIKAAEKFRPELGWRFATYARWWVQASVQDAVLRDASSIRLKSSAMNRKMFFSMGSMEATAERNLRKQGISPTSRQIHEETARLMNVHPDRLDELKASMPQSISLNTPVGQPGGGTADGTAEMVDLMPCTAAGPEELVIEENARAKAANAIARALQTLTERERTIILRRTMNMEPARLEDLSVEFEVTRERVRQLEAQAVKKLKVKLEQLGVKSASFLAV